MNIPQLYDFINVYDSQRNPSAVHASNTGLARYFRRYLLQKVISVFEFDGIPDHWAMNYFQYVLFVFGFVGIIETKGYGVIPQMCTLSGRDVFYQPTNIIVSNPHLKGIINPEIGTQCALVKMQPDYGGVMDIVNFYADMMALCAESAGMNMVNSKLAYVFLSENKAKAEGFKKMFDKIASGEPAVFPDSNLFKEDGTPNWTYFSQNLKQNYIAGDILDDMRKWEDKFNTDVGIPNANTYKKERLVVDEVNANNIDVRTKVMLWADTMQRDMDKANELFGLNLSVKYKYDVKVEDFTGETGDLEQKELEERLYG